MIDLYSQINSNFSNNLNIICQNQGVDTKTSQNSSEYQISWLNDLIKKAIWIVKQEFDEHYFLKKADHMITLQNWSTFYEFSLVHLQEKVAFFQEAHHISEYLYVHKIVDQLLMIMQWKLLKG